MKEKTKGLFKQFEKSVFNGHKTRKEKEAILKTDHLILNQKLAECDKLIKELLKNV